MQHDGTMACKVFHVKIGTGQDESVTSMMALYYVQYSTAVCGQIKEASLGVKESNTSAETNSNFCYSNIWPPKRTNID